MLVDWEGHSFFSLDMDESRLRALTAAHKLVRSKLEWERYIDPATGEVRVSLTRSEGTKILLRILAHLEAEIHYTGWGFYYKTAKGGR